MIVYLKKCRYFKESSQFGIYEVSAEEREFCMIHKGKSLQVGEKYRVAGHWEEYQKEKQFIAEEIFHPDPESIGELLSHLTDPTQYAFPNKLATEIVKTYGMQCLSIIRENPSTLLEIPGMSKYRVAFLEDRFSVKKSLSDFREYLENLKVSPSMIKRILSVIDKNRITLIKQNPYFLCQLGSGFFKTADLLAKESDFHPQSFERMEGAILSMLQANEEKGHLRITGNQLQQQMKEQLGFCAESLDSIGRKSHWIIKEEDYFYRKNSFETLERTARNCNRILKGFTCPFSTQRIREVIIEVEQEIGFRLSPEQRKAVECSVQSGISLILGKPGTGKTTVIKVLLQVIKRLQGDQCSILLGAPTGIAAWRMSSAAKILEASTLHKILGLFPGETNLAEGFFDENVFVIDEVSMVDLALFSACVERVPTGGQIILLGDENQLPSIGAGEVLRDLLESGIPTTELTRIYRQDAQDSHIIYNANLVLEEKTDFSYGKDFGFFPAKTIEQGLETVETLFLSQVALYGIEQVKILSPYRSWTEQINERIARSLQKSHPGLVGKKVGMRFFGEGDLLLETENRLIRGNNHAIRINNGDIGRLEKVDISAKETRFHLSFPGNREVVYTDEEAKSLQHAYALTIHKSQGSEFHSVILLFLDTWLDLSEGKMLSKPLLYTGMTRAKKQLYWVGSMDILPVIYTNKNDRRETGLSSFIRKEYAL